MSGAVVVHGIDHIFKVNIFKFSLAARLYHYESSWLTFSRIFFNLVGKMAGYV